MGDDQGKILALARFMHIHSKPKTDETIMEEENENFKTVGIPQVPPRIRAWTTFNFGGNNEDSCSNNSNTNNNNTVDPSKAVFVRKLEKERVHSYKTFEILLLGDPRVGKTSIIQRFLRDEFVEEYNPTLNLETYEAGIYLEIGNKLKRFDLIFNDFQGDFRKKSFKLYRENISKNDGIVLVHTKNEIESFASVLDMVSDITRIKREKSCVLVLENKCDELCYYGNSRETRRRSFDMNGCTNVAVSAKRNQNISEAIGDFVKKIELSKTVEDTNIAMIKTSETCTSGKQQMSSENFPSKQRRQYNSTGDV